MVLIILLGAVAFAISFFLTPLVRNIALKMGLVDVPDQERKLHRNNTPRVGGIAIFVAYAVAYTALSLNPGAGAAGLRRAFEGGWWLFAAVTVIFATGLLDDLLTLRPKQKLVGQVLAAVLVWSGGIEINFFPHMAAGKWLTLPLTVAWLVGCTNAFNLIDGLDGLAAGTGLLATVTMIVAALLTHNLGLALVTVPLAGSLLAFLCFNFNPASIFLGDCGSLTIGFLLGCFGMIWSHKITTVVGLAAPLMAVSLPLLDTSIAIVRRLLRNRPIFSPDRGHIHHRLLDRGNSVRQTALLLYAACGVAASLAIAQQVIGGQYAGLLVLAFAVLVFIGIQHLGYLEFGLAGRMLSKGVMFRMIDDEMKLHQLEAELPRAMNETEALNMIRKTCLDLGVANVFIVGRLDDPFNALLDLSACQISVPVDSERMLVLHGLPAGDRPLPIERLSSVVRKHLGQTPPRKHPSTIVLDYRMRDELALRP